MITKEEFDKVVDLRKKGCSYREIEKKLGIAHAKVSAIISANEIIEAERRAVEEEKERIRKYTEEIKTRKRKVEELKRREKELEAKIKERYKVSVEAAEEVKKVKDEYSAVKEEFSGLKMEEEKVKKVIGMAADYQKRKSKLEGEYTALKNQFEADLARYKVFQGDFKVMEERYSHFKDGVKDELIPLFLELSINDKVDFISYLSSNELSNMLSLIIKRKLMEDVVRNLSKNAYTPFT